MRTICSIVVMVALALVGACSPATHEVESDALLAAAAKASAAQPVSIVGYELVMWQDGQPDFQVFLTKSGELLTYSVVGIAGPGFTSLEERPPARVGPWSQVEREAQDQALARALELSVEQGWGSDEAMVRAYLLEDARGVRYLMSPDGATIAPVPRLVPWGE